MKTISILICIITQFYMISNCNAEDKNIMSQIVENVERVCKKPDNRGQSLEIKTTVEGGASIWFKFPIEAEAKGRVELNKKEWEGVEEALQDNTSYRDCVKTIVPVFTEKFVPETKKDKPDGNEPFIVRTIPDRYKEVAKNIGENWIKALFTKDIDTLVSLSAAPFWAEGKVLNSKEEIRQLYSKLLLNWEAPAEFEIINSSCMTVYELYKNVYNIKLPDDEVEKHLSSFNVNYNSIAVVVNTQFNRDNKTRTSGLPLIFHNIDSTMKVAWLFSK